MTYLPDWIWLSDARSPQLTGALLEFSRAFSVDGPPTELCRLMSSYGSDKGSGWHNYTKLYSTLFDPRRSEVRRVFEVGIGTNNPNLVSTMGESGRPGASLRGWRDYFLNASVYGADVDAECLFQEPRIDTFYVDQTDAATIQTLWSEVGQLGFDLIVDDGLHELHANRNFYLNSSHALAKDGLFAIEDLYVAPDYMENVKTFLQGLGKPAALVQLPVQSAAIDNCVALIRAA